mmetsp:Transcript_23527/g.65449  ORF Transcript_23527/g.65449 Transcript_23527/m.65449 type:complete len:178 (+) Transcript_23527:118-651(+)
MMSGKRRASFGVQLSSFLNPKVFLKALKHFSFAPPNHIYSTAMTKRQRSIMSSEQCERRSQPATKRWKRLAEALLREEEAKKQRCTSLDSTTGSTVSQSEEESFFKNTKMVSMVSLDTGIQPQAEISRANHTFENTSTLQDDQDGLMQWLVSPVFLRDYHQGICLRDPIEDIDAIFR